MSFVTDFRDLRAAGDLVGVDSRDLAVLLVAVREFLDPLWRRWAEERRALEEELRHAAGQATPDVPLEPVSAGMGAHAAIFLAEVMRSQFDGRWTLSGGIWDPPVRKGGVLVQTGGRADHFWLTRKGVIFDVAADQFGHPAIIACLDGDIRYRRDVLAAEIGFKEREVASRVSSWLISWRRHMEQSGRET
jgi:hypothetical protein